jgi:hypothetical protein
MKCKDLNIAKPLMVYEIVGKIRRPVTTQPITLISQKLLA